MSNRFLLESMRNTISNVIECLIVSFGIDEKHHFKCHRMLTSNPIHPFPSIYFSIQPFFRIIAILFILTAGNHCEIDRNECLLFSPCRNGGTCTNLEGTFECTCGPGYEGAICDVNIDECAPGKPPLLNPVKY